MLIVSRNLEHLEPTRDRIRKAGGTIEMAICDATSQQDCRSAVATAVRLYGHLDVMINNAGGTLRIAPLELTAEELRIIVATNLDSTFFGAQAATLQFITQKSGGVIINFSSAAGVLGLPGYAAVYAAAKASIINFTISAAIDWAKYGIRVNCISPGPIMVEKYEGKTEYIESCKMSTPMRRLGTPEEIAYPCIFLASDASSFISGVNLLIDGGPGGRPNIEGTLSSSSF